MRPSNRNKIIDAAIRVVLREGLTGVTFDSVAAEASVTRGGMMYHFPSRDALIQAIHEHLASLWETDLTKHAGKPAGETTADERLVAYAHVSAQCVSRAELLFLLDSTTSPELTTPWQEVLERWAAPAPEDINDTAALLRFIARLAADGLWVYESILSKPLPLEMRQLVAEEITKIFGKDLL